MSSRRKVANPTHNHNDKDNNERIVASTQSVVMFITLTHMGMVACMWLSMWSSDVLSHACSPVAVNISSILCAASVAVWCFALTPAMRYLPLGLQCTAMAMTLAGMRDTPCYDEASLDHVTFFFFSVLSLVMVLVITACCWVNLDRALGLTPVKKHIKESL
jgi:hypothetical protein